MTMWIIIAWTSIACIITAIFYVSAKVSNLLCIDTLSEWGKFKQFSLGMLITLGMTGIIALCVDFINAFICVLYLAMIWGVSDFIFWLLARFTNITFDHYYVGWVAIVISVFSLSIGWYLDHHVWQTDYELKTDKEVSDFRVAMFADSHIGTTFGIDGFSKHLKTIEEQNPDIVVVVGDYVDDDTTKEEMIKASQALGKMKTKHGIYLVFGNHDKGYYGTAHRGFSEQDLIEELQKNGIKVLRDETVLIDNSFYLIGRKDFSEVKEQRRHRLSMAELTANLDKDKYMIVLDHQPTDYENQAKSEVDLVLSGHTHGGQLFPFNLVGKWIGANDWVYGHKKRNKTDFIVTSGISDWAIKFKTGTKSEYVIINITKGK